MFDKLRLEKGGWVHDTTPEELRIVLQAEKKKKLEEINKKLKTLHTYSSALNLLTLAGLTWHLSYLARRCIVWLYNVFLSLEVFVLYSAHRVEWQNLYTVEWENF